MEENEINGKIEPGAALKWLEQTVAIIDKYGIIKIIQAILIGVIAIITIASALHPDKLFKMYDTFKTKEHVELIEKRAENTPKIQALCDELRLKTNADRVIFLELHNNTGNLSGLPFFYAAASCESIDDCIIPVSEQYLEVKLSLYPFMTKLFNDGYWRGDMDELYKIDKSLYHRMKSNNVHHSAFMIVEGIEHTCGIIIVSYEEDPLKEVSHDCGRVKREIERTTKKIALLVEPMREVE